MNPKRIPSNPNNPIYTAAKAGEFKENVYYYDTSGRLRKFKKDLVADGQKTDRIRLTLLEKPYKFWRSMKQDNRHNMIAVAICCTIPYIVYKCALWHTERDIEV